MNQPFPTFESHEEARCFKCGAPLEQAPQASGYPPHCGAWMQRCSDCHLTTYYDVSEHDTPTRNERIIDAGWDAYAREEGHYDIPDNW